jgi:hypothetical protein
MLKSINDRSVSSIFVGLATFLIFGCGNPSGKVNVSGTVSWEGQPLSKGDITFFNSEDGNAAGAGRVKDGRYSFVCKPGKMRVEINADRFLPGAGVDETTPAREQYIPDRYNAKSELTAEVTLDGKNEFDFSLTEKL